MLGKLLHKLEEQDINYEAKQTEFETKLRQAVGRHNITNANAFIAEVINLHKSLWFCRIYLYWNFVFYRILTYFGFSDSLDKNWTSF